MKKLTLVALAVLLAASMAYAGWWRTYGDEDNERGDCVQITSDGNYIISGRNDGNLWLLKVDTSGELLWANTYGESEGVRGRWIEETSDGGFIVAPRTPSLLKVNHQGDSLWAYDYGMFSYCVQNTSDGGYAVIGGDNGYGYDECLVLVKTDADGDSIWSRSYEESGNIYNTGFFLQETKDRGFIITGFTEYVDTNYGLWANLWLVKTDSLGNKSWACTYGKEEFGYVSMGYCIRQTGDEGYIITGVAPGGLWLVKTDSLGDTIWTKTYSISSQGTGFSVQETASGRYIVVGVTETFLMSLNPELAKLWLLSTDGNGDTLWTRVYEGDGYDVGKCVQQTSDLGYIVAGYTSSHGAGGSDVYLLKTDSLGLLAIKEEPISEQMKTWEVVVSIGPQIELRYFNRPQGFKVSVFNATGQKVDELYKKELAGNLTWGNGCPSGVYFLQVAGYKNIPTTKRIILIH